MPKQPRTAVRGLLSLKYDKKFTNSLLHISENYDILSLQPKEALTAARKITEPEIKEHRDQSIAAIETKGRPLAAFVRLL